jgi:putative flippase GtrA
MLFAIFMIFRINPDSLPRKLAKFSGIGLVNTALHTGIVVLLVEILHAHPMMANTIAFVVANIFSYWANSRWNFKTPNSFQQYGRFFVASIFGLAITIMASSLAAHAGWHYLIGLALVFFALPTFTFLLHYRWTFKR